VILPESRAEGIEQRFGVDLIRLLLLLRSTEDSELDLFVVLCLKQELCELYVRGEGDFVVRVVEVGERRGWRREGEAGLDGVGETGPGGQWGGGDEKDSGGVGGVREGREGELEGEGGRERGRGHA
jgi:hypothetical protein